MPKTHADDRGSTNAVEDLPAEPVAPAVEPLPDVPAQRPGGVGGELTFGGSLGVTRAAGEGKPDEKPEPEEKPKSDDKPRTMSRKRKSE